MYVCISVCDRHVLFMSLCFAYVQSIQKPWFFRVPNLLYQNSLYLWTGAFSAIGSHKIFETLKLTQSDDPKHLCTEVHKFLGIEDPGWFFSPPSQKKILSFLQIDDLKITFIYRRKFNISG